MSKSEPAYHNVRLSTRLDTYGLIKRVAKLMPPDQLGRRVPDYGVIHTALLDLEAKLKGASNDPSKSE